MSRRAGGGSVEGATSTPFAVWLSMIAVVGLASRPAFSRVLHFAGRLLRVCTSARPASAGAGYSLLPAGWWTARPAVAALTDPDGRSCASAISAQRTSSASSGESSVQPMTASIRASASA